MDILKRTVFYEEHQNAGAKLVPFAGYLMPVQYPTGIIAEHKAVRTTAGMFDVSHMGEFIVRGLDAESFINKIITNDVSKIVDYQALYSALCYDTATIVDDLLVYRFPDRFMLVVNAANIQKDWDHIQAQIGDFQVELENISDRVSLIALQGPRAEEIMRFLTATALEPIGYYHFCESTVAGINVALSRTGYTGEDGFEIYVQDDAGALTVWREIIRVGHPLGLKLCGLGARDTLRLEMGFALYGNDIDDSTTPLDAGLNWIVKLNKSVNFTGKDSMLEQKKNGLKRKLIAFKYPDKLIPRHGYSIVDCDDTIIGHVTSGCFSPMLEQSIGMGYVELQNGKIPECLWITIREKRIPLEICKLPFFTQVGHK